MTASESRHLGVSRAEHFPSDCSKATLRQADGEKKADEQSAIQKSFECPLRRRLVKGRGSNSSVAAAHDYSEQPSSSYMAGQRSQPQNASLAKFARHFPDPLTRTTTQTRISRQDYKTGQR